MEGGSIRRANLVEIRFSRFERSRLTVLTQLHEVIQEKANQICFGFSERENVLAKQLGHGYIQRANLDGN